MEWKKIQRVGFSVQNMPELERVVALGANMVEIKLEKFARSGVSPYFFEDGVFAINTAVAEKIAVLAHAYNISIQFHLPIENMVDGSVEVGLNAGVVAHHDAIIDRFVMLEKLYTQYGIGQVITVHPPLTSLNGRGVIGEGVAIKNAKILFDKLDKIRVKYDHSTLIGIENQTDIKKKSGSLGYMPKHFRRMLRDTRTIGLTIDSGHRRLAKAFSVREFLQLGFPVHNFHFHGNAGVFDPNDWRDDQHLLPCKENVTGYGNYLRYFRRHRIPIVLEISRLDKYRDDELRDFLTRFNSELQ